MYDEYRTVKTDKSVSSTWHMFLWIKKMAQLLQKKDPIAFTILMTVSHETIASITIVYNCRSS